MAELFRAQDLTAGHSRSQQDCADLDSDLSQASFCDSGPWSECRQMRLEASDKNTGEFMGYWEKPTADVAQWRLLPQTKPWLLAIRTAL